MNLSDIKKNIPDSPRDRLVKEMREKFGKGDPFIDIHTHIFTLNDVPASYVGLRLPMTRRFLGRVVRFINSIKKVEKRDNMSGYTYFITTMKDRSSEAIYRRMNKVYYSEKYPDAVYGVLTMDMNVGIKGGTHNSIWTQFAIVSMIRNVYPDRIIPFAAIDPRRKDALELFAEAFDKNKPYKYFGLKVYPSLGYLPSHPVNMQMLEICRDKQIPVLAHCSSGSTHGSATEDRAEGIFVHYDGNRETDPVFKSRPFRKHSSYRDFYNRPHHWDAVLEQLPELKLNLAHFGGGEAWKGYLSGEDPRWVNKIIEQAEKYPNVYTDFSYTLYKPAYATKLKELMEERPKLAEKVLFGSDYYMVVIEEDYRKILERFEGIMGEENMKRLARENNRKYLGV